MKTKTKLQGLINEWNNVTKLRIFEIEVINKESKEPDYIIFDIEIKDNNFIAKHVGLTTEEDQSNFVAFKSIEIDEDFNLDANLQDLYEECIQAIIDSDFYNLPE